MDTDSIKNNKWFRRAAWAAAGLAVLWGVAWLAVPPLVKSQLEKLAGEQLGRKVTVGQVEFLPWTLELTVKDIAVASADGASAQLRIKRFYMDAELQSLLRMAPVIDAIALDEPQVKLTHLGAGKYDVDDILARFNKPADKPSGDPPRFALYNLEINGGSLDFNDKSVNKTHELRELHVAVPFLSNLASQRNVKVEPRLAFTLNGSSFDSKAEGTPFAQSLKTDANIHVAGLDLRPYLGYVPAGLPAKLVGAVIDADIHLTFEQASKPSVKLSGTVQASAVKVADSHEHDLLAFDSLKVMVGEARPLDRFIRLSAIELNGPNLHLSRDRAGKLNLPVAAVQGVPAKGTASAPEPAPSPWNVEIDKVAVRDGVADWIDETTAPRAQLGLRGLTLDASGIAWPVVQPVQFGASMAINGKPDSKLPSSTFTFSGLATDRLATVTAALGGLPLSLGAPYAARFIVPAVDGQLSAELAAYWSAAKTAGGSPDIRLDLKSLALTGVALSQGVGQGRQTLASFKRLEVTSARADLAHQTVAVGRVGITQPGARVSRDAQGRWMFERWLVPAPAAAEPPVHAGGAAAPATSWAVSVGEIGLDGGSLVFEDLSRVRPVSFDISSLKVQAKNLSLDGKRPSPLAVSLQLRAGQGEPGQLDYKGSLALNPMTVQGDVRVDRLPVHAFEPYFADALNVEILRADASFKGQVRFVDSPAGPSVKIAGDSALEEFRANSVQPGTGGLKTTEELLSWKALSVRGVEVALAPATATTVDVKETALTDFYARVMIDPSGRINLQDIVKSSAPTGTAAGTVTASASPPLPAAAQATATGTATAGAVAAPVINFGAISLVNGRVNFSDRFIKPNYTADLSSLNGRLSAFSSVSPSGTPQLADLELRGRAEGTADLEILGKLNPLAKPLALDITGKVRELELPPLTPYSVKYAGHGIERGKLSVDVHYVVRPDGQLTASNRLVLNQLTFGDPVQGAPASLPVKLAVALLADRNGVIDIDLPISGSLNDPQFSLGPVIFKVVVNLIVKAITSPFSLLAGAFGGGGDELSVVSFPAGSAALTPEAKQGLDKVAKALSERPALRLTVVGTSNLEVEREAYRRERLRQLAQAEKRRAAVLAGQTATGVATVSEAEYPALLKEVYKRADMSKPRNVVGMLKDLPVPEMEALLLVNIPVTDDVMRELALQRGVAVKDYLASRKLEPQRLFLGAAKAVAPGAKWSPRAELSLANN